MALFGTVLLGALALVLLALTLRPGHAELLATWARGRGATVRGTGTDEPLLALGSHGRRAWTLVYQAPARGPATLLVSIDCETATTTTPPIDGTPTLSDDGVLVTRVTDPGPEWFVATRLDAVLDALAEMAAELEATSPAAPEPE